MKLVTSAEIQAWEQRAFDAGASTESLMKQAVAGMLAEWKSRFPRPGQALFFCGKGHNGNDGLWLAEELRRLGWRIQIVLSHPAGQRKSVASSEVADSLKDAALWPQMPEPGSPPVPGSIRVLVDALLGSGVSGTPHGIYAEMLDAMKQLSADYDFNISLDSPSGVNPDTGEVFQNAFRADLTLCLGAMKQGLLQDRARPWVGRLSLIPLSLPPSELPANRPDYFDAVEAHHLAKHLPASGYKHQRGTLAIWAGSPGMGGAALLAAQAGLRAGTGLVRLYTHPDLHSSMIQTRPEIMTHSFPVRDIPETLFRAKAWILGPGIGVNEENGELLKKLLALAPGPVVLDADALTLVSRDTSILNSCPQPIILTPHQGELERLLGQSFPERSEAAETWLRRHPSTILVAKGPNTLVASQSSAHSFNASGNPGMASAGMGDVLSGIIGSLLAQGYAPLDAARLGVYWHGRAADRAAAGLSEQCLNACDLISNLGAAWKEIIA